MTTAAVRRGLFSDGEIAQRIKSLILRPMGSVVGAFEAAGAVALTFDDGPDPDVTPAMLEVLRRHDAKATFFVLTDHAKARPDLIRRILDEGHEVGLHFDRHDRITELPPAVAFQRMRQAKQDLAALAGPVTLFRPPYGSQNYRTYVFARRLGMTVVGWTQFAEDWIEQTATQSATRATKTLRGGDIVLMHDGLELAPQDVRPSLDRAEVADLVLIEAATRGLTSVTVGTLLARRMPRRSHWFR